MDPQLNVLAGDLKSAEQRLHALSANLSRDEWGRRPGATRWSPAECIAHLNLTSEALLPALRAGVEAARGRERAGSRYRRDLIGWMLSKVVAPSGGVRTRTVPALMPTIERSPDGLVADFERLQTEMLSCVRAADGLPIDQIKLVSPFDARLKYNLYAALTLVPRHQHRHLLQAERAAGLVGPEVLASAV